MHQTKKGNQYYFGMKSHIGVDAESGLEYRVVGTAANVAYVTQVDQLLQEKKLTSLAMPVTPPSKIAQSIKIAK